MGYCSLIVHLPGEDVHKQRKSTNILQTTQQKSVFFIHSQVKKVYFWGGMAEAEL